MGRCGYGGYYGELWADVDMVDTMVNYGQAGGSFKQICFRTNITYGRTGNINRGKKVSITSYFNLFFKLSLSINRYVKECCLHTYIIGVNRAYHIYCFKNKIINLKL
jgi:hypothetical protein